ncbi:MAG: PspA/IM30 family protein [Eggerthellaceae bacterium]|nr:PspA/IM30 family protein [Eggerthellaceae bacterium]
MGILERFSDISKANVNELLDRAEDPEAKVGQYLQFVNDSLAELAREAEGVEAEEVRTKRLVDENTAGISRFDNLAREALKAGNEGDARAFLTKKQQLETKGASLQSEFETASGNAQKMRLMKDKLSADLDTLNTRKQAIEAKIALAQSQDRINKINFDRGTAIGAQGALDRIEEEADQRADLANAMSELNETHLDDMAARERKYNEAT